MKLIIQIPCFNEERTLPVTVRDLPKRIDGVDEIEVLVIDDGSTDRTADVARGLGVHHIVRHTTNQGLARAFATGLDASLSLGADIIVNTDADNQYRGEDIEKLVRPILQNRADIVIGDRQTDTMADFSFLKKKLQKLGSWVVRKVSHADVKDATSGFRAYSREAALKLNVFSAFTYTLDTIIQAGQKNLIIESVPVHTNEKLRESRLFHGMVMYVRKSIGIIIRILSIYQPFKVFATVGGLTLLAGILLGLRYVYEVFIIGITGRTYIQSVILSGTLLMVGTLIIAIGFVAYLISVNRRISEDILVRVRKIEAVLHRGGEESEKKS